MHKTSRPQQRARAMNDAKYADMQRASRNARHPDIGAARRGAKQQEGMRPAPAARVRCGTVGEGVREAVDLTRHARVRDAETHGLSRMTRGANDRLVVVVVVRRHTAPQCNECNECNECAQLHAKLNPERQAGEHCGLLLGCGCRDMLLRTYRECCCCKGVGVKCKVQRLQGEVRGTTASKRVAG